MSVISTFLPPILRSDTETTTVSITPSQTSQLNRHAIPVLVTHERARLSKPRDHAKHIAPTMLYTWLIEQRVTEYTNNIQTYPDWETKYHTEQCPCPWSSELYCDLTEHLTTTDSIEDPVVEYTEYSSFSAFKVSEATREYLTTCFNRSSIQQSHIKTLLNNTLFKEYNPESPTNAMTQLKMDSSPLP